MDLISRYLFNRYLTSAFGLVMLMAFLGWMVQLLRTIDLVTAKGQGVLTMFSQSVLVVPEVVSIILFICVALGISRSLRAMQVSKELFPIHSGIGLKPLYRSIMIMLVVGVAFEMTLTHQLVPMANQLAAKRSDEINADLIANSSRPGRFTEVGSGLTLMIEGRADDGTGLGFFLHDERDPVRSQTTYAAQSQLSKVDDTLFIRLSDGAIQYYTYETKQMSTLEFGTYQVSVRNLAQSNLFAAVEPTSLELVGLIIADINGQRNLALLHSRLSSALYLISLALFAFFLTMQPTMLRSKTRLNADVLILGMGVLVKVLGTSAKQFVSTDLSFVIILYMIPLIPFIVALIIAWQRKAFMPIPSALKAAIQ
ncbi:LptF/LptG family permease [Maritalea sp.]|uniref:LptF/LptG family permease n=1 Tax=Maritalea sp. TaxID=2003361 RepID=UPI003EF47901